MSLDVNWHVRTLLWTLRPDKADSVKCHLRYAEKAAVTWSAVQPELVKRQG